MIRLSTPWAIVIAAILISSVHAVSLYLERRDANCRTLVLAHIGMEKLLPIAREFGCGSVVRLREY